MGAESCNANAPHEAMFSGESKLSELAPAPGEEELCEASATSSFSSRIPSPFEAAAMDVDAPSGPKGGSSAPGRSWTEAEDQLLLTAIKLHGKSSWAKAAEALAAYNRTMSMCRNRHQRLTGVVGGSKRTEAGNSTTTSVTPSAKPSKKQKTSKPPSAKPSPSARQRVSPSPMHPAEMPPAVGPSALQLDVTSCENPARGLVLFDDVSISRGPDEALASTNGDKGVAEQVSASANVRRSKRPRAVRRAFDDDDDDDDDDDGDDYGDDMDEQQQGLGPDAMDGPALYVRPRGAAPKGANGCARPGTPCPAHGWTRATIRTKRRSLRRHTTRRVLRASGRREARSRRSPELLALGKLAQTSRIPSPASVLAEDRATDGCLATSAASGEAPAAPAMLPPTKPLSLISRASSSASLSSGAQDAEGAATRIASPAFVPTTRALPSRPSTPIRSRPTRPQRLSRRRKRRRIWRSRGSARRSASGKGSAVIAPEVAADASPEAADTADAAAAPLTKKDKGGKAKPCTLPQNRSPWGCEEDDLIRGGVAALGCKWKAIKEKALPNRSEDSIRNRWKRLQELDKKVAEQEVSAEKAAEREAAEERARTRWESSVRETEQQAEGNAEGKPRGKADEQAKEQAAAAADRSELEAPRSIASYLAAIANGFDEPSHPPPVQSMRLTEAKPRATPAATNSHSADSRPMDPPPLQGSSRQRLRRTSRRKRQQQDSKRPGRRQRDL